MEKQDYRNLSIKNSEFYIKTASYVNFLYRNNITTIGQLLDDNFWELTTGTIKKDTRNQLNCLIIMLRHKYLDEPLCYDELLDKEIDFKALKNRLGFKRGSIPLLAEDTEEKRQLLREKSKRIPGIEITYEADIQVAAADLFGVQDLGIINLYKYSEYLRTISPNNSELDSHATLIDFLRWLLNENRVEFLHPYIIAYIESYEKNHGIENNVDSLISLKKELLGLLDMRKNLDNKISDIEERISLIQKDSGIKK